MHSRKLFLAFNLFLCSGSTLFFSSCRETGKLKTPAISARDPLAENRDTSLKAGDDFFNYANGAWFKANPIPASESSNGIGLIVSDSLNTILHKICEECSQKPEIKGSVRQKIGDFYTSGMDTIAREMDKLKPLQAELDLISQIKNKKDLMLETARLTLIHCEPMFHFDIALDLKISSKYVAYIFQGGLGLPERDYYFNTGESIKAIREQYIQHIENVLKLSGETATESRKEGQQIWGIEKDLAFASRKMEDLRDPYKNYNKMSLDEFAKLCPAANWKETFINLGLPTLDTVIIGQPGFVLALDKKMKTTPADLEAWKSYLKWKLLDKYSRFTDKAMEDEDFHFNETIMNGSTEQKPRWKRMMYMTETTLEEILSQEYVAHYVPAGSKERLTALGKNIMEVYAEHIRNLDWMSAATKEKALHKLHAVVMKMGYPDKWKDYSELEITRENLTTNILNANRWKSHYRISKYGKPVDRSEWQMTAENYNAYYGSSTNEIVIPVCNLIVPGFGSTLPDDAVLYGGVGAQTMGHELTHGFDDEGCLFDENGNLDNWWTKEDKIKFDTRTKLLTEQFNRYTVCDSLHINGTNTLGENIADLGGLVMSYEAFRKTDQWKKNEKINGLTPDQRFFLGYAYSWMTQQRIQSLSMQIMSDEHAPAMWRVNGPLSNLSAFYTAFNLQPGDKMYRQEKDRVKIW